MTAPLPVAAAVAAEITFSPAELEQLRASVLAAAAGTHSLQQEAVDIAEWFAAHGAHTMTTATPWAQFTKEGAPRRVRWVDDSPADVWVIGDLHGDLLSLEASLMVITRLGGPTARIAFLGDYIDRGPFSTEVVLTLAQRLRAMPQQTLLLAGNHDTSLRHWAGPGRWDARCAPAEFATTVDQSPQDAWVRTLARGFVEAASVMPRAVFFASGTALVHAGIPQRDLWPGRLGSRDAFERADVLRDFSWCRVTSARHKDPYRGGHDAEFGTEDFRAFCLWMAEGALGWPVTRMLTGHEHVPERLHRWPRTDPFALWTICGLSWRAGELIGPYARMPVIARLGTADPTFYRLHLPTVFVEEPDFRAIHEPASS